MPPQRLFGLALHAVMPAAVSAACALPLCSSCSSSCLLPGACCCHLCGTAPELCHLVMHAHLGGSCVRASFQPSNACIAVCVIQDCAALWKRGTKGVVMEDSRIPGLQLRQRTRASASCLMREMCAAVSSWAAAAALSASWRVSASKACASCLRGHPYLTALKISCNNHSYIFEPSRNRARPTKPRSWPMTLTGP